ncbi:hypothetical protein OQ496_02895 [Acetobacter suratthaniensis]|uniref:Uncharacterized protein n=1 Tax=Acetobacter suratthaniensis TaxID=1502841 RepID=A0ABS3LHD1_9PROT|nr:hypothetical protein [Acetobacter suratthaniensis]MBO1326987.1 hypothetical protein [Acetobacter suratthaniensis]MCX2565403.1 hypothetical protein [Acetobacter suratthaniensis]
MTFFSSAARVLVLAFCLPVMGGLLAALLGLSFPAALLPLIGGAALGAWLSLRAQAGATEKAPPTPAPAPAALTDPDPKLRHDIRGIVSPAMLAAEQLSLSTDPQISKAGTTINDCLDRLTARLKQPPRGN